MTKRPDLDLFFENSPIDSNNLPIRLQYHQNNATSSGCYFHWHEQIEFYYVKEGSLRLNVDGLEGRLEVGDIGFVGWGHPHRGSDFLDNSKHYIIQIDLKNSPMLKAYTAFLTPNRLFHTFLRQDPLLIEAFDTIISENDQKKEGYELLIMANFMIIFTHILRHYPMGTLSNPKLRPDISLTYVHKILHFIGENYQKTIHLDDMASTLGLSKAYMCRIFKKHTNQTIIQHLNEQKCHYAASLIYDGKDLQTVSELVGFNDYNYFSRTFMNVMGKRPTSLL